MRILIVEDEKNIAMLYKDILEEKGFEVEIARDGIEGLEKIKQNVYEVILSDIVMPRMNGEQFYLEVKKLDQGLADKIIFVTGVITDFIKSTGNKYLEKPLNPEQLIETVRKLIT